MKSQEWQFGEGGEYLSLDFTQCRRSDGTIYGSRGECTMKGSKEVKPSEGGVGVFGTTGKDNAKKAASSSDGEAKIKKLGSQATIDLISEAAKMTDVSSKDRAKVIQMGYAHLTELAKGEGKKPPTLTSIVSGSQLKKIGIDPDKANVKSGSRGKDDTKIAKEKKLESDANKYLEKLREGRDGIPNLFMYGIEKPNNVTKKHYAKIKAAIDAKLKEAKAEKDEVKERAFSILQQKVKQNESKKYSSTDWSSKSTDEVIRVAERIRAEKAAGTLTDLEGAKKVQKELQSRLAARQSYGNLGDTNNQAAHSPNAQRLMTVKEAKSFYAGNPSICTGNWKSRYKTVCKKVFSDFSEGQES